MIKEEILKALRETEGFLSGQELCGRLHVSRTAVWKAVTRLKEEGYEIESVQNRGYRLIKESDVITEAEIGSRMRTKVMGRNCICFEETDSTNVQARQRAEQGAPHGTLICAETQTAGRGRRGRAWASPPGEAVYMSLILRPRIRPEHASMLTLVMGLAAADACRSLTGADVRLKWPNDLVIDGKKAAGILTEMSAEMDCIHYIVTGIGVNVNAKAFPENLPQAVSLRMAAGRSFSRAELIALCMERFEAYYEIFEKTEDLTLLKEEYGKILANTGREVRVLEPSGSYTGTALGISDTGELLVRRSDGTVEAVYAGEVSVRGIYGYV